MIDKDGRRILVLDGDQPAALAIVRSLAAHGMTVDAGERAAKFLSSHSRHVRDALVYPDPLSEPAAFVDTIAERLARTHYDLVIPVAEDTLQPLAAQRERIEKLAKVAIAPNAALEIFTDKARTFALAEKLGVPIPKSITLDDFAAATEHAAKLDYPVVLKPARSIGKGKKKRTKVNVAYAHDPQQFLALAEPMSKLGEIIVQEYFRGAGVGVEILADHGEVVYAFQHKRLHELPLTGGGSCLRESVPVNEMLLEYSRKLMREVGWHGVAMVEFKLDEATNECRLMEVNPRFWGSLPLAVAAGADFPYYLVELLTREKRPDAPPAKTGVLARKLSADVYWYVQVLKPDQDEPLIRWPTRQEALRDFMLTFSPKHHFDVQSLGDLKPGLVDAAKTGAWVMERATAIARQKWAQQRAARVRSSGKALKNLEGAKNILFVCYGNINRSALADHHLKKILSQRPGTPVVRSAGFHEETQRPADPVMTRVAAEGGVDLSSSRSKLLSRAMVEEADLIFGMEMKHLERIFETYPEAKSKTFLLSAVTPDGAVPLEIADPYHRDLADYEACFRQVTACTTAIADALGVGANTKLG